MQNQTNYVHYKAVESFLPKIITNYVRPWPDFGVWFLCSNKGMDHLSTMKRKNVVLVYDLLLEMLDAHTSSSGSQTYASSPSSDSYTDQHPYGQTHPGPDEAATEHHAVAPRAPAEARILDRHLQAPPLQSSPPAQRLVAHMAAQSNE